MSKPIELPTIPDEQRTPPVDVLVKRVESLADRVQSFVETSGRLRDEVAVLKGEKRRPVLKPSKMEQQAAQREDEGLGG